VERKKCQGLNAERSSTGIRTTLVVEDVIPFQNHRIMATSPVTGDEEEMILPKSTSHCGITITTGAMEMPLSRSVKTQVVAVHHHVYMWRQFYHLVPKNQVMTAKPMNRCTV
jgi:hypothetical protein